MTIEEALTRLEDACGTQLDESIALKFVAGFRSAAQPPMPERRDEPTIEKRFRVA